MFDKGKQVKRQMTPRERVLASIRRQPVDRLPTDYWGVPEITQKLFAHTGARDMPGLAKALDMDKIMSVDARLVAERRNMWDIPMKRVPLPGGYGTYDEPLFHPIGHCGTIAEVEACYAFPTTDMFDYSGIAEECRRFSGYAIEGGYISLTYFYEIIRGTENMCMDMVAEPELCAFIFERIQDFACAHARKILEAADGMIDITQVTDDFGTQSGLMFSPEMTERYLGAYYRKNIAMAKSFGAHVFHHDDGAMVAMLPWLAGLGIEVLNPLQWHLPGWDLAELKRTYGGRLCFHGGVDNQWILPFGTEEDVRNEVRACAEALFADRTGFIVAPCHNAQAMTPVQNLLALYDEAGKI